MKKLKLDESTTSSQPSGLLLNLLLAGIAGLMLWQEPFGAALPMLALAAWTLAWPWRKQVLTGRLLWLILLLAVIQLTLHLFSVLLPVLLAFILAYILEPIVGRLSRVVSRTGASLLVVLCVIVLLALIGVFTLPQLLQEAADLAERVPELVRNWQIWLSRQWSTHSGELLPEGARQWLQSEAPRLAKQTLSLLGSGGQSFALAISQLVGSVMNLVLVPVFTLYISANLPRLSTSLEEDMSPDTRTFLGRYAREIDRIFSSFFRGQLLVSAAIGLLTWLGLLIAGVKYSLLLGLATGVLSIIPYIGTGLMLVVSAVVAALVITPWWSGLLRVALVFFVVQSLEGWVISPRILGRSVGVHPGIALLSLLICGSLFNVVGMILAVPLAALVQFIWLDVRRRRREARDTARNQDAVATSLVDAAVSKDKDSHEA